MMKTHRRYLPLLLLIGLFSCLTPMSPACATAAAITKAEDGKTAEETPAEPIDELGRSTPRGTVAGFLDSLSKQDFEKAAQYLDLAKIPSASRSARGVELAKDLQTLLDKGGWFFPGSMLSNEREGRKEEENLEEGFDLIGKLKSDGREIDITAQRKEIEGKNIWLVSSSTLEQLRGLSTGAAEEPVINKVLPDSFIETKWFGAPAGHWLAVILLLVSAYFLCWTVVAAVFELLKKLWTKKCSVAGTHVLDTVRVPLSLYVSVWLFAYSMMWAGISIIIRQHMAQLNVIVAWAAIALLLWRLIDIFAEAAQKRLMANGRFFGVSSILYFFRRMTKIVFGIVLTFIILDNFGVDVTAGLAALGIGGIALALGAQKTLENFIGSLAIVIDQPLHIGDFCKIGDVSGTVEDIGMRSTRLRTNDRTLVTIPNGDLSNQRIENLARRNRFLVNKKFQLRYDATSDQIRLFAKKTEELLFACEEVTEEGFPVRYLGPGPDGHQMELFFYINVSDVNEYLKIQQDLMLKMSDLVKEHGLYYIIPSQTMLPAVDQRGEEAGVLAATPATAVASKA